MINFLKIQYQIGKITKEQLDHLVEKGKITQDDFEEITEVFNTTELDETE